MPVSPFDLTGRVALITGAYRGLGFAIARGMAQAGALVILNGRSPRRSPSPSRRFATKDCRRNSPRSTSCSTRPSAPRSTRSSASTAPSTSW